MNVEGLPYLELLSPLIFVLAGIYLLGPMLPLSRSWARTLVFVVVWLVVARYLSWRFSSTVLPADGDWYEVGWVYFCFAVEALALFDAFILYLAFLRTSDRRNEADAHEARLRTLPAGELPSVDVYIPTFNEPMEVLEKTITGVLCLDYPNFNAWVLDDGRRPWVKAFCEAKGVGYLTRPNSAHAKAGNINHALTKTSADFVAIFDADFIPQRNFLMRTMGFFVDPGIGVVQVPHAFYNYDPTQSSLALQTSLPDDQRFFFDAVMPSRDGWNAAFCCGSNSVTRRAALRSVGDALPTESITEDMLFTITLLRNGYITRYLCVLRAAAALGARRNANPLSRRRAIGSRPDIDAAASVPADPLVIAEPHARIGHYRPVGVPLDGSATAGQRHNGSHLVLSIADGAGCRGGYLGIRPAPVFSICRPGARDLPKF
jgi:cellulose synthase (UDP-forming)